jgi:quinol-cytochrome oxidoreductase complex cytochrome b subunit
VGLNTLVNWWTFKKRAGILMFFCLVLFCEFISYKLLTLHFGVMYILTALIIGSSNKRSEWYFTGLLTDFCCKIWFYFYRDFRNTNLVTKFYFIIPSVLHRCSVLWPFYIFLVCNCIAQTNQNSRLYRFKGTMLVLVG